MTPPTPPHRDRLPYLDAIYAELKQREFGSLAEVQAFLDRRIREYNAAPQAELGGLAPTQVSALGPGDWRTTGVLRVNGDLTLADVAQTEIFHNARLILRVIGELGPAKLTPGGQLARSVVAVIFERMRWVDPDDFESIRYVNKVINEDDVAELSSLRYLLHQLGFFRRRKGLLLSKAGREALRDERAGALYSGLFIAGFRDLNLRDEAPESPAVQQVLPFALYQVGRLAGDWVGPDRLAASAWLGDWAGDRFLTATQRDARDFFTRYRLIMPLLRFGLLEARYLGKGHRLFQPYEVRKTALFDRVVRFEF